jgi:hypothetical protein
MFQMLRNLLIKFLNWLLGGKTEISQRAPPTSQPVPPPAPLTTAQILDLMSVDPPHYRKREYLCTYAERKFYEALREAVGKEYLIFVKVRMGDIIYLEKESGNEKVFNNQIWCKHVDFVLCNKWTLQPLLAIELDDEGHRQFDRREVDEFKNKAFAIAQLPLLRMKVEKTYPRPELRAQIFDKIERKVEK